MSVVEKKVSDLLKEHNLPADSAWLHAQSKKWIMKHSALEYIGAQIGVEFDQPTIVQIDLLSKVACFCITGRLGNKSEWSFGEATADNCKMAYYAAMAEKRGKDRVILKLLNLHGSVYSEDEADDFKQPENKPFKNAAERKRFYDEIDKKLKEVNDSKELEEVRAKFIKPFADKVRAEEDEHWMQLLDQLTTRYLNLKNSFAEMGA